VKLLGLKSRERFWERTPPVWAVLMGYFLICAWVTWPLILHFRRHVIGVFDRAGDLAGTVWINWLIRQCFFDWSNFAHTYYNFYPHGKQLVVQIGSYIDSIFTIPLQLLFGFPLYYNIECFAIMIFSAYGGYLLVRHLCGDWRAAFLGGAFNGFNFLTFRELEVGRATQAVVGWVPIYIYFLYRTREERSFKYPLLAGLFLGLSAAGYWFYALWGGFFTIIFLAYYAFADPKTVRNKAFWLRMVVVLLVGFLVALPFGWPYLTMAIHQQTIPGVEKPHFPSWETIRFQRDTVNVNLLLIISDSHEAGYIVKLTPLMFILGVGLLLFRHPRKWPWLWIASLGFFYLLSLGPFLHLGRSPLEYSWNGHLEAVKLPFLWLFHHFPFFSRFTWPGRVAPMVFLCLSVLAGINLAALFSSSLRKAWYAVLIILILTPLAVAQVGLKQIPRYYDYFPNIYFPMPTAPVPIPPFYTELAREPGDFALIEIPFRNCQNAILYQTIHGKKLWGGMSEAMDEWVPPEHLKMVRENSVLDYFNLLNDHQVNVLMVKEKDLQILNRYRFRYVILQKANCWLPPPNTFRIVDEAEARSRLRRLQEACRLLFGAPIYTDNRIEVFVIGNRIVGPSGKGLELPTGSPPRPGSGVEGDSTVPIRVVPPQRENRSIPDSPRPVVPNVPGN